MLRSLSLYLLEKRNMHITIKYHDANALTIEEVVRQAAHNYGKHVKVEAAPDSNSPHDYIYFGLQQIITHEQMSLLYDKNSNYQSDIAKLRSDVLFKVTELLDTVIIENEGKV